MGTSLHDKAGGVQSPWNHHGNCQLCIYNMSIIMQLCVQVHSCGEWVCGVSDDGVSVWRVEGGNSGLVGALDKTTPQQLITVATWDSEVGAVRASHDPLYTHTQVVSDGAVLDRLADRNTVSVCVCVCVCACGDDVLYRRPL